MDFTFRGSNNPFTMMMFWKGKEQARCVACTESVGAAPRAPGDAACMSWTGG